MALLLAQAIALAGECQIYFARRDISNGEKKCLFKRGATHNWLRVSEGGRIWL
jgi:hypothetical protein